MYIVFIGKMAQATMGTGIKSTNRRVGKMAHWCKICPNPQTPKSKTPKPPSTPKSRY